MADDIEGVRRTLALYCQLMDDGAYEDVARLFEPDARWTVLGQTYVGADEIRQLMSAWPSPPGTKHLTVNAVIDVLDGHATAVSDFLVVQLEEFGGVVTRVGRYHDSLRMNDSGRWAFAVRENRGAILSRG